MSCGFILAFYSDGRAYKFMRILLTNDDGILSPGLTVMASVLQRFGEVCIAAPADEQSGVGPAITFLNPLNVKKAFRSGRFWGYAVEGTPVDCVKIGIDQLAGGRPDLLVSGINNGLNVGINVLYSGTVAAVQEGAWQGIPSVAVSTQFADSRPGAKIGRAAEIAGALIEKLLTRPHTPGTLYNINIPFSALTDDSERVAAIVPLDMTPHWGAYEKRYDPINRPYYWLSDRPNPNPSDANEALTPTVASTDYGAVASGKIAVTPLSVNLTCASLLREMKEWNIEPGPEFQFSEQADAHPHDFQIVRWIDRPLDDRHAAAEKDAAGKEWRR